MGKLIRYVLIPLSATVLIAGCASIIGGSGPQAIQITSSPSDATLTLSNLRNGSEMYKGTTPYTATLERSAGYFRSAQYRVEIEKEGFEKWEFDLKGRVGGWYLGGNLIFGGLIGWLIVDPLTGAMWTLDPKTVNANLQSVSAQKEGLTIVLGSAENFSEGIRKEMKPVLSE